MPMRPLVSRNASRSSPKILIFFGGPSRSGSSSLSSAGIQKRRSRSPIGVSLPVWVKNSLSALLSIFLPLFFPLGRRFGQSLLQVGDDVLHRFDAYRQADHVGAGAGCDPLLVAELAMGRRGGVDDQALGVADVGEVREQIDAVDQLHAGLVTALDA